MQPTIDWWELSYRNDIQWQFKEDFCWLVQRSWVESFFLSSKLRFLKLVQQLTCKSHGKIIDMNNNLTLPICIRFKRRKRKQKNIWTSPGMQFHIGNWCGHFSCKNALLNWYGCVHTLIIWCLLIWIWTPNKTWFP